MRPASIVKFDRYFLLSLGIGLVNAVVSYDAYVKMLADDPATAQFGASFVLSTLAFGFGIPLLLWYLVARKASNVAKWLVVVLTGLGLLGILPSLSMMLDRGILYFGMSLATFGLQLYAVYYLFRPDAKAWLVSKGKAGTEPDVFS